MEDYTSFKPIMAEINFADAPEVAVALEAPVVTEVAVAPVVAEVPVVTEVPVVAEVPEVVTPEIIETPQPSLEGSVEGSVESSESYTEDIIFRTLIKNYSDEIDISTEVFDFTQYETIFYNTIHTYDSSSSTKLRILGDSIESLSLAVLLINDTVFEITRDNVDKFQPITHTSIINWYKDVTGKTSIIDSLDFIDKIVVGEEYIPLRQMFEEYTENNNNAYTENALQNSLDEEWRQMVQYAGIITLFCVAYYLVFCMFIISRSQNL